MNPQLLQVFLQSSHASHRVDVLVAAAVLIAEQDGLVAEFLGQRRHEV